VGGAADPHDGAMTPDDLAAVHRSWAELRRTRLALQRALTRQYEQAPASPLPADERAEWLIYAVSVLVDLLPVPSRLADRARALGEAWPDPLVAPSFAIEGRAWLAAAAECQPCWSPAVETAWRQAWLLLSDVLAAESLSPFSSPTSSTNPTNQEATRNLT
jgi:hypothetical protein